MSAPRWDPFDEILAVRESMGWLIDDVLSRRSAPDRAARWQPAVEMFDAPDRFVARFEVPGADPDAIEVRVDHQRLTVRGSVLGAPVSGARHHVRELRYGPFERSIALPRGLSTAVTAELRHGVLEVGIRKVGGGRRLIVPIEIQE